MITMFRIIAATAVCLLVSGIPTLAQDESLNAGTPRLKSSTTVMRDTVRIGDLIDNAGDLANIPVFRSPDLGTTGVVSASDVLDAVRAHDLIIVDTAGVTEIEVTRAAREITKRDIEQQVAKTFAGQYGFGDADKLTVAFERQPRNILVEPQASANLHVVRSSYDPRNSRFDVTFSVPGSPSNRQNLLRYAGTVIETVPVPVLVRPMNRGETIRSSDVVVEPRPKSEVTAETVTDLDRIIGYSARLVLRANQPLRRADVVKPDLVKRDEFVTILYEMPGMMLTIRGKALEAGAEGDMITVLNVQSKRNVQGVVTGPGRVALLGPGQTTSAENTFGSVDTTDSAIDPTENLARQGR
jgi:flagella basal body P-ring formation protein FlgA